MVYKNLTAVYRSFVWWRDSRCFRGILCCQIHTRKLSQSKKYKVLLLKPTQYLNISVLALVPVLKPIWSFFNKNLRIYQCKITSTQIKPDTKDMFLVYTHVVGKPINDMVPCDLPTVKRFSKMPVCYMNSYNGQLQGDMHNNDCPFEEMYMID